jgi:hypothetical protein
MPFTAIENINPEVCDKLANLSFGDFQKLYSEFTTTTDKNGKSEKDTLIIYKRIKKYCRLAQSHNYKVKQTYKFADGMNSGRLFILGYGLQNMPKAIRGALSDGYNTDLDAKNCHPNLLLYYTRQKNMLTNYLAQYCMNRQQILNNVAADLKCSPEDAKQLFIISMNSNKYLDLYNNKKIKCDILINFDKEMKQIQQSILDDPENETLKNKLISVDFTNKNNLAGSLLNHILCDLENTVLNHITDYCFQEGINIQAKCFDGVMIEGDLAPQARNEIIRQFDLITSTYGIKWAHKSHMLGFKQQLYSAKLSDKKISYCADNLINLAKYIYINCFKSRLHSVPSEKDDRLFLKSLDSNLYITGNKHIYMIIKNWVCEQDLYISVGEGEYIELINNAKNPDVITQRIIELSASDGNPDFLHNLYLKSLGKLNFRNGVFEVSQQKTGEIIIDWDDDPRNCEGLFRIEYDFDLTNDYSELKTQIFQFIIDPIFAADGIEGYLEPEVAKGVRDCILYRLARAVFGVGINDKNGYYKCEGVRSSGKGILSQLFHTTLGEYCQSVSSSNFINKAQQGDAARNYAFLADQQFTRLLYTNEFEIQGKNQTINGSLIKSIIGRDTLEVRKLHENPFFIDTQCCLWMFANQFPEIVPNDCLEHATPWNMPSKFVSPEETERLPMYKYYRRDDSLKNWIKNPDNKVGLGFILILLDYVKGEPKKMPQIIQDEIATDNNISSSESINPLAQYIQFSPNTTDEILTKEIKQKLASNNINLSDKLIKAYMSQLGCINGRNNLSRLSCYKNCIFI